MRFALEGMLRSRSRPKRAADRTTDPAPRPPQTRTQMQAQSYAKAAALPYGATERAFFDGSVMIW